MATRKTLFLNPSFGNVPPPTAGGAYQDMPTVQPLSPLGAAARTSIIGAGQGNMALPNPPPQTQTGLGALSSSQVGDLAKIAAILGGASLLTGSKTPTTTTPTTPKPTTPTTPTTPTIPNLPVTPKAPTGGTTGGTTGGLTGGAPNGAGTGTTGGLDTSGNVVYPKDPSGGTPYDDDGNLNPGWELNENNDPVWVGVQSPLTPPPVPVDPTLPPVDDITPIPVVPTPPSGGLNQVTPKAPTTDPSTPVVVPPITLPKEEEPAPEEEEPAPEEEPVEEAPVDDGSDENGFVSYAEDDAGNIWGITADGEQVLFMPVMEPPVDETDVTDPTTTEPEVVPEPEPAPEEPVYAEDEAGNIYQMVNGEWQMIQEASPAPEPEPEPEPEPAPEPVYAEDSAGNVYELIDGQWYMIQEAVPQEPIYEEPVYVDPYDPYYDQTYTGEPDYWDYKNGGLAQAKKLATGGGVHMADGGDIYVVDSIDNGDGTYTQQYSDGSEETFDNPTNASVYTPSGTSGTTPMTTSTSSIWDDLGLSNLNLKDITGGVTGALNSAGTWLKDNPVLGGASAALIMNLLSNSSGGGGTNYKPNMAAAGVKPHTTDFGIGPARAVTSGSQTPYYSPEQAGQLNTYLGVPGYDIQRNDPNAQPNVFTPATAQGGLAAAAPAPKAMADGGMAAASQYYSYGKPVDPMEVLGIRKPPVAGNPETQAVANGGSMHPKGPLGVPIAEGRHDYRQGAAVNGPGDGQSDDIPAMLADGEYVIDAELVSMLGNGSNKAGAKVLDQFRQNVRAHKRSAPLGKIPPKSKSPLEYMKGTKNG